MRSKEKVSTRERVNKKVSRSERSERRKATGKRKKVSVRKADRDRIKGKVRINAMGTKSKKDDCKMWEM